MPAASICWSLRSFRAFSSFWALVKYLPSFLSCSTFSFSFCFLRAFSSSLRLFSSSRRRSSSSIRARSSASALALASSRLRSSSCCFWRSWRCLGSFLPGLAASAAGAAAAGSSGFSAALEGSALAGAAGVVFFFAAAYL